MRQIQTILAERLWKSLEHLLDDRSYSRETPVTINCSPSRGEDTAMHLPVEWPCSYLIETRTEQVKIWGFEKMGVGVLFTGVALVAQRCLPSIPNIDGMLKREPGKGGCFLHTISALRDNCVAAVAVV